jgi:hypothetical protein
MSLRVCCDFPACVWCSFGNRCSKKQESTPDIDELVETAVITRINTLGFNFIQTPSMCRYDGIDFIKKCIIEVKSKNNYVWSNICKDLPEGEQWDIYRSEVWEECAFISNNKLEMMREFEKCEYKIVFVYALRGCYYVTTYRQLKTMQTFGGKLHNPAIDNEEDGKFIPTANFLKIRALGGVNDLDLDPQAYEEWSKRGHNRY